MNTKNDEEMEEKELIDDGDELEQKEGLKKILVMGLDNVGKTSIVLSLTGDVNLLNFLSLSPTKGTKITDMVIKDAKYRIWDFGGQKFYRDEYLEDYETYLRGASKLIYVIDIQDNEKYDLSLTYLKNILDRLKKLNQHPPLTVFLHKADPNLKEIRPNLTEEKIKELSELIKNVISNDWYLELYKTSIYTVFEKKMLF